MENELAVIREAPIIKTYDEVERVAKAMAASGYFQDAKSISQAIVKILAGSEIGFGPFASMQGVNIIKGRPSYNANMLASSVKASGKYDYKIVKLDDNICDLAFYENGKEVGHSVFTIQDARKAGTSNLDKFPRNMLFARAMSNGVRWYCPDVTNGNAVYTPEELGAEVDENGNIIDGESVEISAPTPEPAEEEVAKKNDENIEGDESTEKEPFEWEPGSSVGEILSQAYNGLIPGVEYDKVKVFKEEVEGDYNALILKIRHEIEKQN